MIRFSLQRIDGLKRNISPVSARHVGRPGHAATQIILNLIELDEKLKAISALLELALDVTQGLDVDVELLAQHLQLPGSSQQW
jgi:hypothetical protein